MPFNAEVTRALRREILEKLGGRCSCSGEDCWHSGLCIVSDVDVIQIDHVNGNGAVERRKYKGSGGLIYLKRILGRLESGDYQLLCANCNWKKRAPDGAVGGDYISVFDVRLLIDGVTSLSDRVQKLEAISKQKTPIVQPVTLKALTAKAREMQTFHTRVRELEKTDLTQGR